MTAAPDSPTSTAGSLPEHGLGGTFNSIAHVDNKTGRRRLCQLPRGDATFEPMFVPRAADAPEGDGWLLARSTVGRLRSWSLPAGFRPQCPASQCNVWRNVMSLDPLVAAPLVVQVHAFTAMAAFALGIIQLAGPKGTLPHRTMGYVWVGLMLLVATSSFAIHGMRQWGRFSTIHLLSVMVLVLVPLALLAARRHHVGTHCWAMIGLFAGALVIAGGFTLLPGRLMHRALFGG
jgi:uncharacterized membrane protein